MPPTPPQIPPLSDEVLMYRLGELLSRDRPNDAALWSLVATLGPERGELRARAARLIQTSEALRRDRTGSSAQPRLRRLAKRITDAVSPRWRPALVVLAGLTLAAVGYAVWPAAKRNAVAPVEVDRPFPLPFPLMTNEGGRIVTYQHGRLAGLHVLSAPGNVSLDVSDGSLRSWDLRGQFRSAWAAPYREQYFVEGCLMMDSQYLYIGAHVGDPWPLRSASEPKATTDGGWRGGSIQIRLATDLDHVWPIQASHARDKLIHLTLWSYKGRGYLHLARGMDFNVPSAPLESPAHGYEGHFRKTDDDQGYVMKCRIPWKLLGLDKAPYGHELGMSWDVLWSDQSGQEFVGKLTDFYNATALRDLRTSTAERLLLPGKQSYQSPASWGKAICPASP